MSSTEALPLELDAQQVEQQQLRAENRKLRNENPGEAEVVDLVERVGGVVPEDADGLRDHT